MLLLLLVLLPSGWRPVPPPQSLADTLGCRSGQSGCRPRQQRPVGLGRCRGWGWGPARAQGLSAHRGKGAAAALPPTLPPACRSGSHARHSRAGTRTHSSSSSASALSRARAALKPRAPTVGVAEDVEVLQQGHRLSSKQAPSAGVRPAASEQGALAGAPAAAGTSSPTGRAAIAAAADSAVVGGGGGPAGSAPRAVHAENAAVAPKLVVGAAVGHAAEAKQAQRARAHDAGFAGHIQVTAAGGRWSRWWSARVALAAQAARGGVGGGGVQRGGRFPTPW